MSEKAIVGSWLNYFGIVPTMRKLLSLLIGKKATNCPFDGETINLSEGRLHFKMVSATKN
jgi:hypothetical protein